MWMEGAPVLPWSVTPQLSSLQKQLRLVLLSAVAEAKRCCSVSCRVLKSQGLTEGEQRLVPLFCPV